MQTIIFLGPDRVGKTYLINRTYEYLAEINETPTLIRNFKEISPEHHSPMQQFRDVLNEFSEPRVRPGHLLLGRFVSDTLFYEERRGQMPPLDPFCAIEIESMLSDMSHSLRIVLLSSPWEQVSSRHVSELRSKHPEASLYWIKSQLALRKKEHEDYYDHTYSYAKDSDLYSCMKVIYPDLNSDSKKTVFDYLGELKA